MVITQNIPLRDPFVMPDPDHGMYYLYGTTNNGADARFDCYQSADLQTWEGPTTVFAASDTFWGTTDFWAPEVHRYQGRYYMFASFKATGACRGTHVLVADTPLGPFHAHSAQPLTPPDWECLDGTLYIEHGQPWMVFCHEWLQIQDGAMYAVPLADDLAQPAGAPLLLFRASDAAWARTIGANNYVTDGPFLYMLRNGVLAMLWSSFGTAGYTLGVAYAESGHVRGPWRQGEPLYAGDGGHGMLFRTFDGLLMLALHAPNITPDERVLLMPIEEHDGRFLGPGERQS